MDKDGAGTLAVILGSATFPKYPDLKGGEAFAASARALERCLASQFGEDWKRECLLNLFDSDDVPRAQLRSLREFCATHPKSSRLLIYYVGHGGFFGGQNYYLALRTTEKGDEPYTGLEIRNLALVLDQCFAGRGVVLILDCCFAAEAMAQFQDAGAVGRAVETETFNVFPAGGTSLLCASSKDDMALWKGTGEQTMFSECLSDVLTAGIAGKGERLSLREIGEAVDTLVRVRFGQRGVRPEIHSPRQRGADVATQPLFRNPAYRPPEPKRLPAEISVALRNPIPDIRRGGVGALFHLSKAADPEMLALIQSQLRSIAESDDSFSVRKAADVALQELAKVAIEAAAPGASWEVGAEILSTSRSVDGVPAKAAEVKKGLTSTGHVQTEKKSAPHEKERTRRRAVGEHTPKAPDGATTSSEDGHAVSQASLLAPEITSQPPPNAAGSPSLAPMPGGVVDAAQQTSVPMVPGVGELWRAYSRAKAAVWKWIGLNAVCIGLGGGLGVLILTWLDNVGLFSALERMMHGDEQLVLTVTMLCAGFGAGIAQYFWLRPSIASLGPFVGFTTIAWFAGGLVGARIAFMDWANFLPHFIGITFWPGFFVALLLGPTQGKLLRLDSNGHKVWFEANVLGWAVPCFFGAIVGIAGGFEVGLLVGIVAGTVGWLWATGSAVERLRLRQSDHAVAEVSLPLHSPMFWVAVATGSAGVIVKTFFYVMYGFGS